MFFVRIDTYVPILFLAYHVLICSLSEQASKCNVRGEGCQVQEDDWGHALYVEAVLEVAAIPGQFTLDVCDHAPEQPRHNT